ncbi:DUF3105 domain-containing protein [Streptomyces sp. NPDC046203]|uniref:DUF3105 domain-containing protein n=1 Tax=Streptomyces sp. NPDC046203 TaxID=3154602 RepID=UPI0034044B31
MAANHPSNTDRRARIEEMRRAEQARERRNRILTIGVSAVVVLALVGVGGWAINKQSDKQDQKEQQEATAKGPIEGEKDWDLKKLTRNHVETPVTYPMNPPVGGDHHPIWQNCNGDVYDKPLDKVHAVHSLEHGAVWVTYNKKADKGDLDKLSAKVKKTPYSLMSPIDDQSGAIMLSAWGKQVTVDGADDPRVDAFFTKYVNGPQTPEPGAACTGGVDAAGKGGKAMGQ